MLIQISEADPAPIYVQIANQVRMLIYSGRLRPEQEVPSIRALAEQLLVNPNTVARAYRDLEVEGVLSKKRTTGCYVSASVTTKGKLERLELLRDRVESLVAEAVQLGLEPDDLIGLFPNGNTTAHTPSSPTTTQPNSEHEKEAKQ